jgi:hypothetical protein
MAPPNSPADDLVERPMSSNAKTGFQLRIRSRAIEKPVVEELRTHHSLVVREVSGIVLGCGVRPNMIPVSTSTGCPCRK